MTDVKYIGGHPICDVTARAALAEKADSAEIGELSQLTTTAKDNLVSAVTEVNERLRQQSEQISNTIDNMSVEKYLPVRFAQGSISTTNGADIEASNRRRTSNYFTGKFIVRVGENIKYSIRTYLSDGTYVSASDWNTDSLSLDIDETNKIRFVIAYTSDSEMTPSSDIVFEVYTIGYTDETLERIGIPADAKVVGDKLSKLASNFVNDVVVNWKRGTLTTYNGTPSAADNVIRSGNYIEAADVTVKNTENSTSVYGLRYYDQYKSFIFSDSEIRTGVTELNDIINNNPEVAFFKIITRYADRRVLTDEDVQTLASACSITKEFNIKAVINDIKPESTEPSPNSNMLGNISIKAAKTINFADGTPPVIDWYLLQDTAGNFYISKDLIAKKYLFTFVPPSGNIANWSAGIAGNNDVIFVANAAGLSAPNGRLNDANRVNPVCYLASENYGEMHTIDFGTSIKPCGWLGNVGYTVLPTGRIAFAEYTRGVVQTANVWIIDGAVNDSNNWQITWSSNIIDTTDTTTNGIKHCHEMQWDFYTGVLYFGTGDSPTGSYSYYSLDGGETWNLLYGPDKDRCRRLTYVFTDEKVYWASDSYKSEYHHFFIAERNANGVVDIENATRISLDSTNAQACYGCVYVQSLNIVVMMDRIDRDGSAIYNWYCYDITENQVVKIGEIESVNGVNSHLGFRCNFVDWYPVDNIINVGFNPSCGAVNPDTNVNALCGNLGGTQGDGSTRINNLALSLFKRGNSMSFRARTRWI